MVLSQICTYSNDKISIVDVNKNTYISTENMLPNKAGIIQAASLPSTMQVKCYKQGDVLVSNIRPYFKKIWFAEHEGGCSNDVLVFRAKETVNPYYLFYVISCDKFFEYAMATSKGTKMPRGDKKALMQYEIPEHNYIEQVKIADFLRCIDDKIAINNKINNNLEQQMQTLFTSFFPDIFNKNIGTVGDLISFCNGKKRPNALGDIPVYGGNGILAYTNISNNENCIIVGRVGVYCGNLYYSTQPCWVSDNAISAKSLYDDSQLFSYYLLKNASLPSRHIGTSQPLLTQGILSAIPCNVPSKDSINKFNMNCKPLQTLINNNTKENIKLSCLRDTILPKLMSGEINVSKVSI